MSDSHYYFREMGNSKPPYYEIGKFDPDKGGPPIEVYRVYTDSNNQRHCSCPSPQFPCKHSRALDLWLKLANKYTFYWDERSEKFELHPFYVVNGIPVIK